jgi:Glycosyl transferase family 2
MEPADARPSLTVTARSPVLLELSFAHTEAGAATEAFDWRLTDDCSLHNATVLHIHVDFANQWLDQGALAHIAIELRRIIRIGGTLDVTADSTQIIERMTELLLITGYRQTSVAGLALTAHFAWSAWPIHQRQPLVSILIPSWNPRYFKLALQSALAQTYENTEIIVCDDHRGDAIRLCVELLNTLNNARSPIRYIRNETQLGVRANYQKCFDLARGEYIKYLNDDDLLEPRCVERMVAAFEGRDEVTLVTSHRRRINEFGHPLNDQPATVPVVTADCLIAGYTLGNALLMLGLNIIGEPSTAMFKRSAALSLPPPLFDFAGEPGRGVSDMVLWAKLLAAGNAIFLKERLSSFRIHPEQGQANSAITGKALSAIPALRDKWISFGLHERVPPNVLLTLLLTDRELSDGYAHVTAATWHPLPVPQFTPAGSDPLTLVLQWRARQHPFFASMNS